MERYGILGIAKVKLLRSREVTSFWRILEIKKTPENPITGKYWN
jgi:hypothetical protein